MKITKLANHLVFPECLRWHENKLWFVDMYDGRLCSMGSDGVLETHLKRSTYFGGINWHDDGSVLLVDKLARQILRINGQETSVFADLSAHCSSKLNDTLQLPNGDLLIGEYGFDVVRGGRFKPGNLFRVSKTGAISIAARGLAFPNAMAISTHGDCVYVAETIGKTLSRFQLTDTYELASKTTFHAFEQGHPDGLCINDDGSLWVALLGTKRVCQVMPDGSLEREIYFESQPVDVVTGGLKNTFYVGTSSATASDLGKAELPRTGEILKVQI